MYLVTLEKKVLDKKTIILLDRKTKRCIQHIKACKTSACYYNKQKFKNIVIACSLTKSMEFVQF